MTNHYSNSNDSNIRRFHNVINDCNVYILVWLEDNDNNANEKAIEMQEQLKQTINQIKIFNDPDECVDFLTDLTNQKVILVISTKLRRIVIPAVHDFPQLKSLYIYNFDNNNNINECYTNQNEKVRGVYRRSNDLIAALSTEQRIDSNTLVVNIYSTQNTGNLSEERDSKNALFMYFQILIDILLQMTDDQNLRAKQELIDHFKRIYNENEVQQKLIEEFENNYQPEKAIWWYTRPTFLYNTLNKALRESDYEVLRALRFFINDLYRQLRYVYEKCLDVQNTNDDPILKVYRGQSISIDDLRYIRENIGQYISIQNFLSTSIDRHVGLFFSHASEISPNTTRILFQFNIDTRMINTKPYGNITSLSYFPDEQEVMIMLGSIFKIEQVKYDECEQTWIAILSLCTEDDYALKELMKQMKEETDGGITSLGWLLYNQGEYEKATNYFEQLLLESRIDDFDRGGCYRGLGAIQIALQNYDEALENFQKELDLLSEDDDEENIAETYAKIGEVYFFKNDYEPALLYEQRAHDILLRLNSRELSDVHRTIGNIYHAKQQFNLALEYYEKALAVDCQHRSKNHYNFGITYECISSNYHNT